MDKADGYKRYREDYVHYRANQEQILGELDWPPLFSKENL
jgi:hypothetical protein